MNKMIVFDPLKNQANIEKHGVPLSLAKEIIDNAVALFEDTRHDYKEVRNITFGYVKQRLYVAVWHERNGVIRSISVRKANKREVNRYGTQ